MKTLAQAKKEIKALGYSVTSKKYSDFIALTVKTKDGGDSKSSKSTSFIPKGSVYVRKNGTYNKEVAVFVKDNGVWKPVQAWAKTSYGKWQVI